MKTSHMLTVIREVLPSNEIMVWLTSGEKLTGVSYTYDVSGIATLEQQSGPPIMIDLDFVMAVQTMPVAETKPAPPTTLPAPEEV